jgi:hypothetical protein
MAVPPIKSNLKKKKKFYKNKKLQIYYLFFDHL